MSARFVFQIQLVLLLALGLILGCGGGGNERFIPTMESGRDALELTLDTWKAKRRLELIDSVQPAVQPVNSMWQTGRRLVSYEILKEIETKGPAEFQVRLKFEGQDAPEETSFIVLGQDPLYVYWKPDLEKSSQAM